MHFINNLLTYEKISVQFETDYFFNNSNLGVLSPYPTVVMEMKAHQKPSKQPIRNGRGNSVSLLHLSNIQATNPDTTDNNKHKATMG